MKFLVLFGPLFLAGCGAMPIRDGAIVGPCARDEPELQRRRDPVKGWVDRLRFVDLGRHCRARGFRLQCEWIFD